MLVVLHRAGEQELTAAQVTTLSPRGSLAGIRKVLTRLVQQGVVLERVSGPTRTYRLNRNHVASKAVLALADLRSMLFTELHAMVTGFPQRPVFAAVYGSMARGDGDDTSDLDILLVRPDGVEADDPDWAGHVELLRKSGERASGNWVSILELSASEVEQLRREDDPVIAAVDAEGVPLTDATR